MNVGAHVAVVLDCQDVHNTRNIPRGLRGDVVETFSTGHIVAVEFDLSQGIPNAKYAKRQTFRMYVSDLVEIHTTHTPKHRTGDGRPW